MTLPETYVPRAHGGGGGPFELETLSENVNMDNNNGAGARLSAGDDLGSLAGFARYGWCTVRPSSSSSAPSRSMGQHNPLRADASCVHHV